VQCYCHKKFCHASGMSQGQLWKPLDSLEFANFATSYKEKFPLLANFESKLQSCSTAKKLPVLVVDLRIRSALKATQHPLFTMVFGCHFKFSNKCCYPITMVWYCMWRIFVENCGYYGYDTANGGQFLWNGL